MDSSYASSFGNMSDAQLKQTFSQISAAGTAYAAPTPQHPSYTKNLHHWTNTATPPPKAGTPGTRSSRARTATSRNIGTSTPTPYSPQPGYHQPIPVTQPPIPAHRRAPLPTMHQAFQSTYASRLRTGATLLMQPILAPATTTGTTRASRRGGHVNYADPGSGDDLPDAGAEVDSDDSDFQASGGTRTQLRQGRSRMPPGVGIFSSSTGVPVSMPTPFPPAPPVQPRKAELDKSYLGLVPPDVFIKPKPMGPTPHVYPDPSSIEMQSKMPSSLIPIRVELETDTHRIRDCFVWNLYETLTTPENFAKVICHDLDLPSATWEETIATQMRAQIEEWESIAGLKVGMDGARDIEEADSDQAECRVILSIDVQIATYHLLDHIEWDLLSPLTPEAFARTLCSDIGLSGEAVPLIAHAIHEELMKHKKDAVEWGLISSSVHVPSKDRTGLGRGTGPKTLKSVWRDWAEQEEMKTRFEELTQEEVDRREIERERASRRLRRETSKFQNTRSTKRYRYY